MLDLARRRSARLVLLAPFVLLLSAHAPATTDEQRLLDATNELRARHGLPALVEHEELVARARWWADTLAREGSLRHSDLTTVTLPWRVVGENVGRGGSADAIHDALAASPAHRANLLGDYRYIGVGATRAPDGTLYVVEVLLG